MGLGYSSSSYILLSRRKSMKEFLKIFMGSQLFHAITIVSYTTMDDSDCWIVKESSGKDNPIKGIVYVLHGTSDPLGFGGINVFAFYLILLKKQHNPNIRTITKLRNQIMPSMVQFMVDFRLVFASHLCLTL